MPPRTVCRDVSATRTCWKGQMPCRSAVMPLKLPRGCLSDTAVTAPQTAGRYYPVMPSCRTKPIARISDALFDIDNVKGSRNGISNGVRLDEDALRWVQIVHSDDCCRFSMCGNAGVKCYMCVGDRVAQRRTCPLLSRCACVWIEYFCCTGRLA